MPKQISAALLVDQTYHAAACPDNGQTLHKKKKPATCTKPKERRCADLCEGPQALQAASHSSSKAALAPQGGEQQAVLGWVGLIGTVGSAKLLDGFVSRPGELESEVHSPLLVLGTPAVHRPSSFGSPFSKGVHGRVGGELGRGAELAILVGYRRNLKCPQ